MIIGDPTLTTLPEFRTRPNSTHSNIVSSMGVGGGGLREGFKIRLFYDCQVVPIEKVIPCLEDSMATLNITSVLL